MPSHIRKILIAGAGTAAWWKRGDEAIFYTMVSDLRHQFPGVQIGVISANPKGSLESYQVQEIPVPDIQTLIEFAKESDLLILGGGGLFYDYWGFHVENLLTESQTGAGVYVGFALLAKILNKPLMIYGVGVGPLVFDIAKHYTRLTFEQVNECTVRDVESKKLLISLGVLPEKIRVTADPVWGIPEIPTSLSKKIMDEIGLKVDSPILGVSVRPWKNTSEEEWEGEVARGLDDFIDSYKGTVLFIPFHKNDGVSDDYAQSQKIRTLMRNADSAHVINSSINLEEKISILRLCNIVLGMRLHANIIAMRYSIPAVGLAYDPKVSNLFSEVGRPDHTLDLRFLTAETLQFLLHQVYKDRDALKIFYTEVSDRMATLARENVSLASHLIQNIQKSDYGLPQDNFDFIKLLFIEHSLKFSKKITVPTTEQSEKIKFLNNKLNTIQQTFSWKITRPLRLLRSFFQNPRKALLKFFKYL